MEVEFFFERRSVWTQGANYRVFDAQRRERYEVVQRFAWGIKVELYDDARGLKARLRERMPFGRWGDLTLFDHTLTPCLTWSVRRSLSSGTGFMLSDGRAGSISKRPAEPRSLLESLFRRETLTFDTRCGDLHLELAFSDEATRLRGTGGRDEALAIALVLPIFLFYPFPD